MAESAALVVTAGPQRSLAPRFWAPGSAPDSRWTSGRFVWIGLGESKASRCQRPRAIGAAIAPRSRPATSTGLRRGSALALLRMGWDDLPYLAGGVVHQHVPGGRVGPPPAESGVQR
jgi:hypothetical protein